MPTYAIGGKYTAEALAAVRAAGYPSREAAGKQLVESLGGRLLSWYWTTSPDQDFVAICEVPSGDEIFAMGSIGNSSGAFVRTQAVELYTSAEAQAAVMREARWRPPGE